MIFVNFKTYKEATGEKALSLVKELNSVSEEKGVTFISCPQAVDLKEAVNLSETPVWAQHVDVEDRGRATGWFPPEIAKESGAEGVFLNHSEHKLSVGKLGETLSRCKDLGLKTLVFADTTNEALAVSKFEPDFIGYEPPELIASKETSVAKAKPDVIREVVTALPNSKVIVGAGVKGKEDVKKSLELGAHGVALASAVVLAKDRKKVLIDLAEGFKK